jgi:peptidoglycan/LPS O-acetylase OafA/YrhL
MNRQFPALSGLAMLLIVLNHTIEMGTSVPVQAGYPPVEGVMRSVLSLLQGLGVFAVPTFLSISGTFVAYAARGEPPTLTGKFLRNSLSHILWPYVLWSLVFYAVVFVQFDERYGLLGYVKNLLTGYPFHFVPLLVLFYLLSPLLVRLGRRWGWLIVAGIGLGQLLLINVLHPGALGFSLPSQAQALVPPVIGRTLADWAIYFPLGLVYGLNARRLLPGLQTLKWAFAGGALLFFALGFLHFNDVITLPLASYLAPLSFVLFAPSIKRDWIPAARRLETVGKRSYGLYLTHLIVLDLVLWGIQLLAPGLFNYQLLLLPLLFSIALFVPLLSMDGLARSPRRAVYRYVFG